MVELYTLLQLIVAEGGELVSASPYIQQLLEEGTR
jgi:hypothetical protein